MKRIGGLLLVILGLIVAVFGIVRAATAEESTVVEVTVPGGESQFIFTAPGVLEMVNDTVAVTLEGEGTVQWALATTGDVRAYVGDAPATEVTGLESWEAASSDTVPGTDEARAAIDEAAASEAGFVITGSDLWLDSGSGEGSVELELTPDTSFEQSLIATTSTGQAPDLTLTWNRPLALSNPMPVIAIGVLLLLIGALLLLSARQAQQDQASVAKSYRERKERSEAETSIMPKIRGDESPEELGVRQSAAEQTGGAFGAGILPAVNQELLERELSDADRVVLPVADEDPDVDPAAVDEAVEPAVEPEGSEADAPAEAEQAEPAEGEPTEVESGELGADDVVGEAAEEEKDWRALWNFKWGTPFQKGDEDA